MKKRRALLSFLMIFPLSFCVVACTGGTDSSNDESGFAFGGKYLLAKEFSEGLALVKDVDGLAYIGSDGKVAYRPSVIEAGNYSEGKTWYKLADGSGGYMDKSGEKVGLSINAFATTGADDYKNGLACVTSAQAYGVDAYVLDESGNRSTKFAYCTNTGEYGGFYEGISYFLPEDSNLYGYVEADGDTLVEAKYLSAGRFSCGRARVEDESGVHYIDTQGEVVFSLNKDVICGEFSDNALKIKGAEGYYFLGLQGERLFEGSFEEAGDYREGKAVVKQNGALQVVDKTGKVLFNAPEGTTEIGGFYEGVSTYKKNGKWGYLNADGMVQKEAVYEYADNVSEGYGACRYNSQWGYVRLTTKAYQGEEVVEQVKKYRIYFDLQLLSATIPAAATQVRYDEAKGLYYQEVQKGEKYELFQPICEGYVFSKWQKVNDSSSVFKDGVYEAEEDCYLLAVWSGGEIIETPIK